MSAADPSPRSITYEEWPRPSSTNARTPPTYRLSSNNDLNIGRGVRSLSSNSGSEGVEERRMGDRGAKNALFDGFAEVAKALANGRRAELIDVLVQGERHVDELSAEIG